MTDRPPGWAVAHLYTRDGEEPLTWPQLRLDLERKLRERDLEEAPPRVCGACIQCRHRGWEKTHPHPEPKADWFRECSGRMSAKPGQPGPTAIPCGCECNKGEDE